MNSKACKVFVKGIGELFVRQCKQDNLEPFTPNSDGASSLASKNTNSGTNKQVGGWVMTEKGTGMFLQVYGDIGLALDHFNATDEQRKTVGLTTKLRVRVDQATKPDATIVSRIGESWLPDLRKSILASEDSNPFLSLPTMAKLQVGRLAAGLLEKAECSERFADLLLARTLGLAQLCGIDEITTADLMYVMANATFFEKLARAYIGAVLGIHKSVISNMAFGTGFGGEGKILGSTQNVTHNFDQLAPKFLGDFTEVGSIHNGTVTMKYPLPAQQLQDIVIKVPGSAKAKERESVHMLSGWANSLARRPENARKRTFAKEMTVGLARDFTNQFMPQAAIRKIDGFRQRVLHNDIHGNPLHLSQEAEKIKLHVKRVSDGRLIVKPAEFGDIKGAIITGQGVFGKSCGCTAPDPEKLIGKKRKFNGVPLTDHFCLAFDKLNLRARNFDGLQLQWIAGDLPMQILLADVWSCNTYVQVKGECLYCCLDRALGTGCDLIIAGGML
jgi:hypothetical protein